MPPSRLLAALLISVLGVPPLFAQDRPSLPSQQHQSAIQARENLPRHTLPAVDTDALRAEEAAPPNRVTPYRYGTVLDTQLRPDRHGTWERLPSGQWLWRLRIRSREAVSLSVGFTTFQLPDGARLFLYDASGSLVHGPYTDADATGGQHWTPLVTDEEIVVELIVPPSQRSAVRLKIGKVVHGYRALHPSRTRGGMAKAGACNLDVACDEADPWRSQIRSVGRYTYESGGDSFVCTGSLVNNTAEDLTYYFLTAEHCIPSPEVAQTMVVYWNYQNETCRERGSSENGRVTDAPLDQSSTGATLVARYGSFHEDKSIAGKPDLALVKIDDVIPQKYNLYYNGWSRRDIPTNSSVTIHHPQGHGKRISFDRDPSIITGYGRPAQGDTHFRIGDWELGTTEGGSSGAPLFNGNQRVVGILSGGFAGCSGNGSAEDNDEPDWFGRLAAGFNKGDYKNRTLADVLDPTNSGIQTLDGLNQIRDSIPPAPITDLRATTVTPDSVTLRWTATGDDGETGTAERYLLRYRVNAPIQSRSDFDGATSVSSVPPPKPAGTPQSTTVGIKQDSSYYFAIVAQDKVKNASPVTATERDVTPVTTLRVVSPPAPNPARHRSTLAIVVNERQTVRVDLYDALGRHLKELLNKQVRPFRRQPLRVDLSPLASGMYFVRIRGKNEARTEQIAVVK